MIEKSLLPSFSLAAATAVSNVYKIEANKPKQVIIQPQNITLVTPEGSVGGGSGGGAAVSGGQPNKLYYVIPKSNSSIVSSQNVVSGGNPVGTTTKTMILNGKEAKTVLLSSTTAG